MVEARPPADPVAVALRAARAFEAAGVPYLIGGSVASTYHGEPRSTMDVDFAVHLDPDRCAALVLLLERDFFVQPELVLDAVREGSAFNAIDRSSFLKVDVHVRPREGHHAEEIRRAREVALGPGGRARVATVEDACLRKLWWYRMGNGSSDHQWRDVLGMLKVVGGRALDLPYLRRWAPELGVADLLDRALAEAGIGPGA